MAFSSYKHMAKNIGFPNGPVFRYGNFFIPRVEKSSKISPRAKNLVLPRAVGPREARFFSQGLIIEDFLTRGMKKFPYLKITAHSEIVFLFESIYAQIELSTLFWHFFSKKLWNCHSLQLILWFFPKKLWKHGVLQNFFMGGHAEIRFLHGGSCGNQIPFQ